MVTLVVRWSGPSAVVRVKTPTDVIVALPSELPPDRALGLAKLVLNSREYAELSRKIKQEPPRVQPPRGSSRQARYGNVLRLAGH